MRLSNLEYLFLLLSCFAFPGFFSLLHRKLLLKYKLHIIQPTVFIASVPFILFDMAAVSRGYWRFNAHYITGFNFINLPIEELLFFILIPQSCLIIWIALKRYNSFEKFKEDIMHHFKHKNI